MDFKVNNYRAKKLFSVQGDNPCEKSYPVSRSRVTSRPGSGNDVMPAAAARGAGSGEAAGPLPGGSRHEPGRREEGKAGLHSGKRNTRSGLLSCPVFFKEDNSPRAGRGAEQSLVEPLYRKE